MNILIAPDKFRGSLEADQVCEAMAEGVRMVNPMAEVVKIPLADGGEGTARALTLSNGGRFVSVEVQDPLGRSISSSYGLSPDSKVAFIEMALASGLALLNPDEREPLAATSFGTGQLIADALDQGVETIILGIGGSATTDAGTGMAEALGYRFLDEKGSELRGNGGNLSKIVSIDGSSCHLRLNQVKFIVACDVTNPLGGETGAAYVFAPQKGATAEQVRILDKGLQSFSNVAAASFGKDVFTFPGAGAAGGVGAGALWFLNAELKEGSRIVIEFTGLEEFIPNADLVITGEGKLDEQTLNGKLILGLSNLCKKYNVPVAALCGTLAISPAECEAAGLIYAASVLNRPQRLEEAQVEAFDAVRTATFHLVRLFYASSAGLN
jgi:glycerate kinase